MPEYRIITDTSICGGCERVQRKYQFLWFPMWEQMDIFFHEFGGPLVARQKAEKYINELTQLCTTPQSGEGN